MTNNLQACMLIRFLLLFGSGWHLKLAIDGNSFRILMCMVDI
uniref:Uncharacterized protein n=1 Tax=Rhizophora mucronata TaxID=61149 RepID=A0A2P2PEY2_RHIMU